MHRTPSELLRGLASMEELASIIAFRKYRTELRTQAEQQAAARR